MINLAVHVQCGELFEDFLTIGAVNVLGKAEMLGAVDVHHQTPRIKEISFIDPISFNLNSHWRVQQGPSQLRSNTACVCVSNKNIK